MSEMKMSEVERNAKASAVMGFAEMIAGAYMSGFIDNHPTVYDIYRSAQNHVKDNYQVETDVWNDKHAKESRSDTYENLNQKKQQLVEEVERLRGERDELIEDVKQELLKSTSVIFRPHLEGVFAVIEGRIARGEKIKGEDNE